MTLAPFMDLIAAAGCGVAAALASGWTATVMWFAAALFVVAALLEARDSRRSR